MIGAECEGAIMQLCNKLFFNESLSIGMAGDGIIRLLSFYVSQYSQPVVFGFTGQMPEG